MKSRSAKIHTLLVAVAMALLAAGSSLRAAEPEQTRLLLTVMVEGLETEYLDLLRGSFGDGGFRRLENDGLLIANADFGTPLDATAATVTLLSGASPSISGIGSAERFDRTALRSASVFADAGALGNFTTAGFSPAALRVSTISDEARLAAGGTNVVYAVAPSPEMSIAMAGHAANAALWLDVKSGNWASSTYYKEMPVIVATRNRATPLQTRLDTMSWTPAARLAQCTMLPEHLRRYPFRYVFPRNNTSRMDLFEASPLLNREVSSVASDILSTMRIGQHEGVTDVLSLAFSLKPYHYGKNTDNRPELFDAYLKLDAALEQLFSDIDRRIGLNNTAIIVAGTPARRQSRRDDEQWGIPFGEFSTRKAASLLNMYLIALYGNGDYVSAYHGGQIYLNHKLLKDKDLDEREVRTRAAEFLVRMTGIDRVHTIDDILTARAGEHPEALRRNTVAATAGDLLVSVAPGFELVDDYNTPASTGRTQLVERMPGSTAPVFIMAPAVAPGTIGEPVDARAVAPAVSRILRIRSPNGAALPPLSLKNK